MSIDTPENAIALRVTDVVAWDGCKRKWWLNKNWSNGRFTPAFFVGTGVHKGLEAYYRNGRSIRHANIALTDYAEQQRETFSTEFVQTWEEVDADRHIEQIFALVDHYALYDRENFLAGDVLEDDEGPIIERRMSVPILDHNGLEMTDSYGNPVLLSGQCDLALGRQGSDVIVDHKTFSMRTMAEHPEAGLEVDEQGTAYCYLWWRTYGELPTAFIYNVLIKEHPRPPDILKNGSLSMNKAAYTSAPLFRQAIKDNGLSFTPYLDHLAWLEQQGFGRFFQRWQSSRNMYEIQAYEKRLAIKTQDILRLVENPDVYAHSAGSSYRCGGCQFIAPCKSYDDGGDGDAVLETGFYRKNLWEIE